MRFISIILAFLPVIMAGCKGHADAPAETCEVHGDGTAAVPYTVFTDSCEYFAEIAPMVTGEQVEAGIHITRLSNYKPVASGIVTMELLRNGRVTCSGETDKPAVPGIFRVTLTPGPPGPVEIRFILRGEGLSDTVTVAGATIYNDDHEAAHAPLPSDPPGAVKFTKEMAWKIDFRVLRLMPRDHSNTLKTGGRLMVPPAEVTTISARGNGIVVYRMPNLVPGKAVEEGSALVALTGQGLTSQSMEAEFAGLKSKYEASRADYMREKVLAAEQIVSQKHFNQTRALYLSDSAQFHSLLNGMTGTGMLLPSPVKGYILEILQPNGSYVTEGTPILTIARDNRLLLIADVPQQYRQEIPLIRSASFRPAGAERVFSLNELGGSLVAKGNSVEPGGQFIPVTFSFSSNGLFAAGSYVETYLHTATLPNQLVIPEQALFEEQGVFYVYVQSAGETYVKREVTTGISDGANVSILSGLSPGNRVVTRGGIFIKASSQISGAPSHGHAH